MKKGFTLIELVMALGILGMLLSIAYQALNKISEAKQLIDDEQELVLVANSLLTRLTREFQSMISKDILDPKHNTRMLGDRKEQNTGQRGDSITFMSKDAAQYMINSISTSDVVEITYRVEKDPDNKDKDTFSLIRDELPGNVPYQDALKRRLTFPVAENLVEFELEYFDPLSQLWGANWDNKSTLPQFVYFKVGLKSRKGKVVKYASTAIIRQ